MKADDDRPQPSFARMTPPKPVRLSLSARLVLQCRSQASAETHLPDENANMRAMTAAGIRPRVGVARLSASTAPGTNRAATAQSWALHRPSCLTTVNWQT